MWLVSPPVCRLGVWLALPFAGRGCGLAASVHVSSSWAFFFVLDYLTLSFAYECFACTCVCVPRVSLVPMQVRREHRIPWDWSYTWL